MSDYLWTLLAMPAVCLAVCAIAGSLWDFFWEFISD